VEQQDQSERPSMFQSPSMRIWLLIALNFGCTGIFLLLSRIPSLEWLGSNAESGFASWYGKLSAGLFSILVFGLPIVIFTNAIIAERFSWFRLNQRVKPTVLIMGVLAMLTSVFFIDFLYSLNKKYFTDPSAQEAMKAIEANSMWLLEMNDIGALLLCLLMQAFVPALVEELFFRAGVQQLAVQWMRKPHVAILLSAAFFSFMHFDGTGFLARFILGAMLGYMFYWTGSLRINVLAHFAFNAFSVIDAYVRQHAPDSVMAQTQTTPVLAIISAVVATGAFFTVFMLSRKREV
jgi:membrane protease YdiL (CAAX protease family)